MNYIKLQVGDVRQEGDEYRKERGRGEIPCHGSIGIAGQRIYMGHNYAANPDPWTDVSLIGHNILISDLILTEYRRPL